jgi:hypothetical protein
MFTHLSFGYASAERQVREPWHGYVVKFKPINHRSCVRPAKPTRDEQVLGADAGFDDSQRINHLETRANAARLDMPDVAGSADLW